MSFSTGALIGVGVGLALATFEYLLVVKLAGQKSSSDDPEAAERRLRPLKRLLAFGFVVLPVVGFVLGDILVDLELLPR
jgi:hypothetical protein